MARPGDIPQGGWQPGRLQVSHFIRDYLSDGKETWGHDVYGEYVVAVDALGKLYRGGKRRHASYESFRHYLTILRRLGLIEYVPGPDKEAVPGQAIKVEDSGIPNIKQRNYMRAVLSKINDSAWNNPRKALYPHHAH